MESLAGRVILLWGWRRALTAFLAGSIAALAQPPFDFFAACFISFPVLVWLLDGAVGSPNRGVASRLLPAFSTGWWWGFGYFVAGLWWTGAALLIEAKAFAWALPFAVLGLPALLALFYGLAALVGRLFWDDGFGRIAALAFGFGLAEWLRATLLTGFPWNAIGYAAMPLPMLMQSVHVTGLFGMNAIAVFVFAAPAMLGSGRHRRLGIAIAAALAVAHAGYGIARLSLAMPAESTRAVRVVQPSIEQARKWDRRAQDEIFATYLELTRAPPEADDPTPELIVWPETAVPFLFSDRPEALPAFGEAIDEGQMLLAGAVRTEKTGAGQTNTRYYNAIVVIDDTGTLVDAADKVHLVPFGEYVPGGEVLRRLGFQKIAETVGPFSAGSSRRILPVTSGARALPLICYEVIFPGLVLPDAARADFIVNLTNDAWYGNTPGPYQHFRQAQVRAVEAGLPMVRAANNGISAVVDGYGRIVDAFALDAYGALDAEVPVGRVQTLSIGTPLFNGLIIVAAFGVFALAARIRAAATAN